MNKLKIIKNNDNKKKLHCAALQYQNGTGNKLLFYLITKSEKNKKDVGIHCIYSSYCLNLTLVHKAGSTWIQAKYSTFL